MGGSIFSGFFTKKPGMTVLRAQKELGTHIWTAIGSQVIFSVGDLRWSRTATINQDNWLLLTHYFFVVLHIIQ